MPHLRYPRSKLSRLDRSEVMVSQRCLAPSDMTANVFQRIQPFGRSTQPADSLLCGRDTGNRRAPTLRVRQTSAHLRQPVPPNGRSHQQTPHPSGRQHPPNRSRGRRRILHLADVAIPTKRRSGSTTRKGRRESSRRTGEYKPRLRPRPESRSWVKLTTTLV